MHLVMTQIVAAIGPAILLCDLEIATWMSAVATVTSEMNEATDRVVAVAVDRLPDLEIARGPNLATETMTGAAMIAAVREAETVTAMITVLAAAATLDLPLVAPHVVDARVLAVVPATAHALARDPPQVNDARNLHPPQGEGHGLAIARVKDGLLPLVWTSTAMYHPPATAASRRGAECDLPSVIPDHHGRARSTDTFLVLSKRRQRRGNQKLRQNRPKSRRNAALAGAAAVDDGAIVGGEVEVDDGVEAGEVYEFVAGCRQCLPRFMPALWLCNNNHVRSVDWKITQ